MGKSSVGIGWTIVSATAAACSASSGEPPLGIVESAIVSNAEVMGFEKPADWSTTAGQLGSTTVHTQGSAALSVSNIGYAELTSVPLGSLGAVSSTIAYDIQIPTNEPNPNYYGSTQLFVSVPSLGVNNTQIGQQDLSTYPPGAYKSVQFAVPASLVTKLAGTYSDLTFKVVLNAPQASGNVYLLDNLHFVGVGCTVPTAGMTISKNTTLCGGAYEMNVAAGGAGVIIGADNVTVTCQGTMLSGTGPIGPVSSPNVGFQIGSHAGITIDGCGAHSFRYGLVATSASNLAVKNSHFDANFTDATQQWVQDDVQGGGLRFERVNGATVSSSTFAKNWNGIELRGSTGIRVLSNTADHSSSVGALLFATTNSELRGNDFSWAVRGDQSYGGTTFDSAGILLDESSSNNLIADNTVTHGGDGIFIRGLLGPCSTGNTVSGNDTSFSPNNAIESWCDYNVFSRNTASSSQYGIWLGGSDHTQVVGNTVNGNKVDGISVQIAENRHSLYQDNTIRNNGRAGLLLSGREYQAGASLGVRSSRASLANSSHLVVARNTFSGNTSADVFTANTRDVTFASNCGLTTLLVGNETNLIRNPLGTCGGAAGRSAPVAHLADVTSVALGATASFDASSSAPFKSGDTLAFYWLIQAAGPSFSTNPFPPMLAQGLGTSRPSATFNAPGLFDVDVTVDDGRLAGFDTRTVAVLPGGTRFGNHATNWSFDCTSFPSCVTSIVDDPAGLEGNSVHIRTDNPFDFSFRTAANINASAFTKLAFFARARNDNPNGWQMTNTAFSVVLASAGGTITYMPPAYPISTDPSEWVYVEVPLAGNAAWARTDAGGSLSALQSITIHTDTWDANPYDIWLDALTLY